jgi:hypothetical protein
MRTRTRVVFSTAVLATGVVLAAAAGQPPPRTAAASMVVYKSAT